jgi:alpha-aminoadipic semialdehyde synthase
VRIRHTVAEVTRELQEKSAHIKARIPQKGGALIRPTVGIRREDKSVWERRVPITPEDAHDLQANHGLDVIVQTSNIRVFPDSEYSRSGVTVEEDLSRASTTLAVKEIPLESFERGKTYVFFAHVIKGQPYNMAMLKRMMDLGCNLIDYERVTDSQGRRLIFFGRHAGLAGMLDTLWAFGKRLAWEGTPNPFEQLQQAHRYRDLAEARSALGRVKKQIETDGVPEAISPLILGLAGYGNVSNGAQEILAHLPVAEIPPEELSSCASSQSDSRHLLFKVVFREEHMVEPVSSANGFELQDYYDHPDRYRSKFETYLPHLSILVNAIYWDGMYPRLITRDYVRREYSAGPPPRLKVIGDISCDIRGAVEITVRATGPEDPVFVYDPETDTARPGFEGRGPVIMAVDILPSELPRESSIDFSRVFKAYVPAIAKADFSAPFDRLDLPSEVKGAVILHQGQLTPTYRYLKKSLDQLANHSALGGTQ